MAQKIIYFGQVNLVDLNGLQLGKLFLAPEAYKTAIPRVTTGIGELLRP